MKLIVGVSLAAALLLPADADAQRRGRYNPFSFEPYAGAFWDAYDFEADGTNRGHIIGFRAGYQESDRLNLHLNLGYAESDDVATRAPLASPIYDNQWVLTTAGADFALVPGNTSIALGVDLGVGWRRTRLDEPDNGVGINDNSWGTYEVVVPGLTLRHSFSQRAAIWASFQDHIFEVFENDPKHSFGLSAGLSLR